MKQIILWMAALFIGACTLFKKTTKTTEVATQSSLRELEATALVLKRVDKETQIFTYWNDTGVYQYRYIKEQLDQAESDKISGSEKQQTKQDTVVKKTEPLSSWIYIALTILGAGCCLIFYRKVYLK